MYIQGIRQYRLLLLYHGQILLWDYALGLSSGSRAMDKGSWKRYRSVMEALMEEPRLPYGAKSM